VENAGRSDRYRAAALLTVRSTRGSKGRYLSRCLLPPERLVVTLSQDATQLGQDQAATVQGPSFDLSGPQT
jgi:hypothetical protein